MSGRNEARLASNVRLELDRSLARIAANDSTFARVNLHGWGIGTERAGRLIVALPGWWIDDLTTWNIVVRHLDLGAKSLGAALVMALVDVLENSTTLEWLNLSGNRFGMEGTKAVARLIRNNSSLARLLLEDCGITVEGARVLAAAALPRNFGDVGASLLARSLPGNSTLRWLDLEGNEIGDALVNALDAGARELAGLLPNNSLTELDLGGNNISDVGARLLAKALLVSCTVTTVYLGGNDISQEDLERLVDELAEINTNATNPQEALERKVEWLRNLDEGGLRLLGFEERGVEEEVVRLETVCRVGWLIDSGIDGEKEEAVALVLDQLEYFPQAEQRCGLFRKLLGAPERGVEVAASVDNTRGRALYWYAVQCGAASCVVMNILRAHPSLCTCKDVQHRLHPFMLRATIPGAGVGDVMELLLLNPNLVEGGIPVEH